MMDWLSRSCPWMETWGMGLFPTIMRICWRNVCILLNVPYVILRLCPLKSVALAINKDQIQLQTMYIPPQLQSTDIEKLARLSVDRNPYKCPNKWQSSEIDFLAHLTFQLFIYLNNFFPKCSSNLDLSVVCKQIWAILYCFWVIKWQKGLKKINILSRNRAFTPVLHLDAALGSSTMNKKFIPSNKIKKAPGVHLSGILDKNQGYSLDPHLPWSANLGDASG